MTTLNTLIAKRDEIQSQIDSIMSSIQALQADINNFEYECSENEFDDYLDQDGEQHTSVGTFYPSDILKSCDPVAYRCAKSDYESNYDLDDIEEYTDMVEQLDDLESDLVGLEDDLESIQDEIDELD